MPLPEGAEDVTATFGPQFGSFGLVPRVSGPLPDCFRPLSGPHISGPVPAAPLIARWIALLRVLKDPEAHARRFARTIRRWRQRGEPRPHISPLVTRHRLRPDFALVSGALPGLLETALNGWFDTS